MYLNTHLTVNWSILSYLLFIFCWQNLNAQSDSSHKNQVNIPFDENDIIFPFDLTTSDCGIFKMLPENLDSPYHKPTFLKEISKNISTSYEDVFIPIDAPSCFQILRKWTVIDNSQYKPKAKPDRSVNLVGIWTHTQIIKVLDFTPPIFNSYPKEITVNSKNENDKETYVELIVEAKDCSPKLSYSFEIDLFNNRSIDKTGKTNDASGIYPLGFHKITFNAIDGCGNFSSFSYSFHVKKEKKQLKNEWIGSMR